MDTTPNWALAASYKASCKKDEVIGMALSLHHSWMTVRGQARALEVALIEARATIVALQGKIDEDARVMRSLVSKANHTQRAEMGEFTRAQLAEASVAYCKTHGVKSVSLEVLKDALRKGRI